MILIDFFTEASCKGTELIEGWYWYDDADDTLVGGPFDDEEDAMTRFMREVEEDQNDDDVDDNGHDDYEK